MGIESIAGNVRLLILDVDGVLTNGDLFFFEGGEYKAFHARDGLGIALLISAGIELAIISGNTSKAVNRRFKKFGIEHIYQGVEDKAVAYRYLKETMNITDDEIAYMGDDLIDLPVMTQVGLPTAVSDADEFVKKHALWVSKFEGGRGAVRELCEFILASKGQLKDLQDGFCFK